MSGTEGGILESAKEAVASAAQAVKETVAGGSQEPARQAQGALQTQPTALLESASDAEKHRRERGEEEPRSPHKSGLGRHVNIGGVGDFGPVDTERMEQVDNRDMPARVP